MVFPGDPKQEEMFPGAYNDEGNFEKRKATRWYYIADAKEERMIIQRSCGKFAVIELDLRFMLPWLTNRRKEAKRVADMRSEWKVKVYPHDPGQFGKANRGKGGWKSIIFT